MKRLWNQRWFSVLSLLGTVLLASSLVAVILFLRTKGVHEIHRTVEAQPEVIAELVPSGSDWPCWRGTSGHNVAVGSSPPLTWSISENVQWKTSLPGRGHSSPCLWGDQIFVTTADDAAQTISLLCLEQGTGQIRWKTDLHQGGFVKIHDKNSQASSTPACDGRFVYIASSIKGGLWVTAVDIRGQIAWQREAGPYSSEWGYGSSVALYKSLVIIAGDNRGDSVDRLMGSSWLAALQTRTGEIQWRVKRVEGDSFGTPIVAHVAGRDQLLLAGKESVLSYDPATGNVVWKYLWASKRTANTVAFDEHYVFASTRQPQSELVCIRADGEGDVTASHGVWREKRAASDVPSPCTRDGRLFVVGDDGVLTGLDASDGRVLWKRRLGGGVSASPVIAGEHLFCCNEAGQTFVIRLDGRGEIVAENSLGEGIMASPIVSGNQIFIRTLTDLYCLSAVSKDSLAEQHDDSTSKQ